MLTHLKIDTMGLITNIFSATVKTALTPVAVVKDAVEITKGNDPKNTKELLESAKDDMEEAVDDLVDGDVL